MKVPLLNMFTIFTRFRNATPLEFTMERVVQFAREEGDAYSAGYMRRFSRTQVSTPPIRPTLVRATVRPAVCPTRKNTTPRKNTENHFVVSFMEPSTSAPLTHTDRPTREPANLFSLSTRAVVTKTTLYQQSIRLPQIRKSLITIVKKNNYSF